MRCPRSCPCSCSLLAPLVCVGVWVFCACVCMYACCFSEAGHTKLFDACFVPVCLPSLQAFFCSHSHSPIQLHTATHPLAHSHTHPLKRTHTHADSSRLVLTFCVKDIIACPAGCTLGVVLAPPVRLGPFSISFPFISILYVRHFDITIDIFGFLRQPASDRRGANPLSCN